MALTVSWNLAVQVSCVKASYRSGDRMMRRVTRRMRIVDCWTVQSISSNSLRLRDMTTTPTSRRVVSGQFRSTRIKQPRSLATNVRVNSLWTMAASMLLRLSNAGVTAVMGHILDSRDFGIFAVAITAFTVVTAIGEFGVRSCVIRADLDIELIAPTLTAISWASSTVMAGCIYVFAEPIAAILGSRAAEEPVRVLAFVVIIWGVGIVPTGQCSRNFKQSRFFWADVMAFFPSIAILILLGIHGDGAMAFAWSRVVSQSISCVVVISSVSKFYFPGFSRDAFTVFYKFGLPIGAANVIGNFLQNADYAFIGHLAGPALLGTYVLAFNVANWALSLLSHVLGGVLTTAFSRVKDDRDKLPKAITDAVRAVALIAAPTCALIMVLARPLVLTLYGERWVSAVPVLALLSVYGFISVVGNLYRSVLTALGSSRVLLVIQLVWLVGLVPSMIIGVHKDGIVGAAIVQVLIIGSVVLPSYLIAVRRAASVRLTILVKAAFGPLMAAAIAATIAWFMAAQFDRPFLQVISGLCVGGLSYAILTAPQLIAVLGRGLASHPVVKRILRTYYIIGRFLGIPIGPPPRHARWTQRRYSRVSNGRVDATFRAVRLRDHDEVTEPAD